jgi:hypothetical protein
VNLPWTTGLTDVGARVIADLCPRLRVLDLSFCAGLTGRGLQAVALHCPLLEVCTLTYCTGVRDKGIERLAKGCRALRSLSVALCPRISDRAVQAVAHGCRGLTSLNIGGCPRISNVGFQILSERLGARLETLNLSGCRLTEFDLEDVGRGCAALVCLRLRACALLTDAGLAHVLALERRKRRAGKKSLSVLDVGGCERLSAGMLRRAVQELDGLELLELRGCPGADRSVLAPAMDVAGGDDGTGPALPRLRFLNLKGCERVSAETVAELRSARPGVRVHA